MHQVKNKLLAPPICAAFEKIGNKYSGIKSHGYETRYKRVPNILPHGSKLFNKSFLCGSVREYMSLPKSCHHHKKSKTFNRAVKKYLLSQ